MLHLSSPLACYESLLEEQLPITIGHQEVAKSLWMLNIMPLKQNTERDFCRMIAASGIDVNLTLLKIPGQCYKSTPQDYVERHYIDFDERAMRQHIDGLIITGAPLEHLEFEDVRYWKELCQLMEWSKTHARSTLNVCYAAQAALYYHHGVPKYELSEKRFGVFDHEVLSSQNPLVEGLAPHFPMPHSRHTEVRKEDFPPEVIVLAESAESGIGLAEAPSLRQVYDTGHLEYEAGTLDQEYHRDLEKGLSIAPPRHYYIDEQQECGIDFSWHTGALQFYKNWLNLL